jgi:hypothetical protein
LSGPSAARVTNTSAQGKRMENNRPLERPDGEAVQVRQGTGPRAMVSVLFISLTMTAVAGVVLLGYYFVR